MGWKEFCKYYKDENLIKKKCKENNHSLKGVSNKKYLILDGDKISEKLFPDKKSADCILVSKEPVKSNKHDVILCELGEQKRYTDVQNKLTNSGNYICKKLKDNQLDVKNIHAVFVGTYSLPHQEKRTRKPFTICKFYNSIQIHYAPRFFDIKDLQLKRTK